MVEGCIDRRLTLAQGMCLAYRKGGHLTLGRRLSVLRRVLLAGALADPGRKQARVVPSPRALVDLERIFELIAIGDLYRARDGSRRLRRGADLEQRPTIGRQVEDGRKQFIMGRAFEACLVLLLWVPTTEVVLVPTVRNAREARFQGK